MQMQLRTRLKNDATISGLVGTRVDWDIRPQGKSLPAITLGEIDDPRDQHMDGLQTTRGTLVQVDCWAEKAADAVTLRDAVVSLLATSATQDGVKFLRAQDINTGTPANLAAERTDVGVVHRRVVRATVWHTIIP